MKLYWRYKKANGKYSWKPAKNATVYKEHRFVTVDLEEEE